MRSGVPSSWDLTTADTCAAKLWVCAFLPEAVSTPSCLHPHEPSLSTASFRSFPCPRRNDCCCPALQGTQPVGVGRAAWSVAFQERGPCLAQWHICPYSLACGGGAIHAGKDEQRGCGHQRCSGLPLGELCTLCGGGALPSSERIARGCWSPRGGREGSSASGMTITPRM